MSKSSLFALALLAGCGRTPVAPAEGLCRWVMDTARASDSTKTGPIAKSIRCARP